MQPSTDVRFREIRCLDQLLQLPVPLLNDAAGFEGKGGLARGRMQVSKIGLPLHAVGYIICWGCGPARFRMIQLEDLETALSFTTYVDLTP